MMSIVKRSWRAFFRALAAAVIASIIAVSCWHPVFDPMLSASEITIRKLGEPKLYFNAELYDSHGMLDCWFLPQMTGTPSLGVLVLEMNGSLGFKSLPWIDTVNHSATIDSFSGFETTNTLGDAYLVHADPNGNSNFIYMTSRASGQSRMMMTMTTNGPIAPSATNGPFGIGVVAQNLAIQSTVAWFGHPAPGTSQSELVTWNSGVPGFSGTSVLIFTSGDQATVPGKFLSTTTYFYLSCGMSDGSRAIFRWEAATANTVDAIRYAEDYGPLIGALSDGRLLAEKDGIITVLDPNLNKLFKFPAGRLRFVHERYDNTIDFEMKVVFTRSIFVRNDSHDSDGQLLVELYEIPSAELENLAD